MGVVKRGSEWYIEPVGRVLCECLSLTQPQVNSSTTIELHYRHHLLYILLSVLPSIVCVPLVCVVVLCACCSSDCVDV